MANGGNGTKHDTFITLVVALGSFASWFIRFLVTRYFTNKDKKKQRELELLEERKMFEGIVKKVLNKAKGKGA